MSKIYVVPNKRFYKFRTFVGIEAYKTFHGSHFSFIIVGILSKVNFYVPFSA